MPDVIPARPREPAETPLGSIADRLLATGAPPLTPEDRASLVTGLTLSSQRVRNGDIYAALPGSRMHGAAFAADAVASGAVAVLTDPAGARICAELAVPVLIVERPRSLLGELGAMVYGHPASRLNLVAVTGTQGKTTVTRLADSALQTSGVASAVIGTVGTRVNGVEVETTLTTPEAPDLHALFAVMCEQKVTACAMEVSSHALVMGRVDGVVFDVAVFTNLGRDHLDFHADVEDYFAAKASLFTRERARLGLVNIDDEYGRRLVREVSIPVRTFSTSGTSADWMALEVAMTATGSTFTVQAPDGSRFPGQVSLTGDFNVANALTAVAALGEAGFDARKAATSLGAATVPGRLERVDGGQEFLAIVDYAHKPDAVTAALRALRTLTSGRLMIVLGAGGDRDHGKRPLMGEIAARLADVLVVTDDNPRSEDPAVIRAAILAGAASVPESARAQVHEVDGRRAAIRLAVSLAAPGDTLVVAGKGHETGQEVLGTVHPFDDRAVLLEELARR